ncbi:hypothetical protein SOCE26_059130 [Sorangium cellulosum]|uniref:Kazal-like domain-containing protein n=1 Tax=Sorangium cellulosum TaxID=56 RepID=A0A2L0EYZ6_SORCE|nr:hypothetical protein [Sorangium cellulosum]AUX44449.1 hypothetical protein SOCE26_059130 [Sorangium cellulosum]
MRPTNLVSLLLGLLLAACDGTVETPPGGGGAGGGGGDGGADSSSGSATGGGGGGDGGNTPVACGGRAGATCDAATEYCDHPDDLCGRADGEGRCSARPEVCPADCPGVCGCDGQFYCNTCAAHGAGVDVLAGDSCMAGGEYSAFYWPGGLDHVVVRKADEAADRCVLLYLDAPAENAAGLDLVVPEGWGVSRALVSDRAADCKGSAMAPSGTAVNATAATGSVSWTDTGAIAPCTVDVDVSLTFPEAPATERLRATGVAVEGACP